MIPNANLVIIGGGGAGIAAALTALERGATGIIVLEKRSSTGGNSALAGGFIFGAESPPQERAKRYISKDAAFKETMAFHHYDRVDARVLRAFIDKTGDTIRWLENNGIEYEWFEGAHTVHVLKDLKHPAGGFGAKLKILTEKCREGGVQILLNTSGKKILCKPDGPVTGVLAVNKDGEEIQINTRSVIITTGGFTGSLELLKKYFPFYYDDNTYGGGPMIPNMGDGIQLAEEAGAELNEYATLIREPIGAPKTGKERPVLKDPATGRPSALFKGGRLAADPRSLWVNSLRSRFLDENHGYENECSNAILSQPGKIAYALYDDAMVERITEPDPDAGPGLGNSPEQHVPDLREILQAEAENNALACISHTWDRIAAWMGADHNVLKATIEEYNTSCDQDYDSLFAKDKKYLFPLRQPPYYAVKFGPMMIDTVGPIRVNERIKKGNQKSKKGDGSV